MKSKLYTLLPVAFLLCIFALPGRASLAGTSVTGSLVFTGLPSNYFDPGYGFVPASGYLNVSGTTVTISDTAVEFGYDDGASRISADFTNNQLVISDLIELTGPTNGFQLRFTDSAFAGQYLIGNSDTLPLDGSTLVGDLITLNYPGGNPTIGTTLSGSFTLAPVPEPSTLGFACSSIFLLLAAFVARKYRTGSLHR